MQERRLNALLQIAKVLRPGGQALIYVWALEQELNKQKSNYLKESKFAQNKQSVNNASKSSEESPSETKPQNQTLFENCEKITVDTDCVLSTLSKNPNTLDQEGIISKGKIVTENKTCDDTEQDVGDKNKKANYLPVHINRTQFVSQDLLVPWHLRNKLGKDNQSTTECTQTEERTKSEAQVYHRFYHVFKQGELEQLCCHVNDLKVIQSYYDKGNWCVVLEKQIS